ncbi:MAG TPA: winged helix-turn-helix transcriptional regulator [Candidatus Saccharibacteria bacterium]|mgnify:CR=1 FL=1|nr:winged helix-turn-helix transcriptional regulator [Candidatus Saccharibacteria bacterium]
MRTIYSQEQIIKTKGIAKIIGDASNVLILYELMNFGEKSFNELKRMTDINAVTLSKKLTMLKTEGLVDNHKCGKENRYFVSEKSEDFRPLIKDIESLVINK